MGKYIVHKAVEANKVKKKLQRTMDEYAATFMAQPKFDGCCAVVTLPLTGEPFVQSRTGEVYVSLMPVARRLQHQFKREIVEFGGIVLLGEAWNPGLEFNVISGLFRRGEETEELDLYVFDCLTHREFTEGRSLWAYRSRIGRLTSDGADDVTVATHEPGTYGPVDEFLSKELALGGRDGIILRDPNGTWEAGRGTTGEIVKVKQALSFDLRVLEVNTEVGEKTGRTVYKLLVDYGGKRLGVGSGLPHDLARVPAVNDIVEVVAMDYSSDGLLREPRFKGIRHDKLEPDTIAA